MEVWILGQSPIDGPGWIVDTDTGKVTPLPSNRGGGPNGYESVTRAIKVIKDATGIQDTQLQEEVVRSTARFFKESPVVSEILGPNGNVIAIF